MADLIRGKVARILNAREVAVNIGLEDGVTKGMYFDVMDTGCQDIMDPDTKEVLGSIERPKVRVQVIIVNPRISIVATYKTEKVNVGGTSSFSLAGLSSALMPPKWETRYETLRKGQETWEDLDARDSYVKVGDPVVQVVESGEQVLWFNYST